MVADPAGFVAADLRGAGPLAAGLAAAGFVAADLPTAGFAAAGRLLAAGFAAADLPVAGLAAVVRPARGPVARGALVRVDLGGPAALDVLAVLVRAVRAVVVEAAGASVT